MQRALWSVRWTAALGSDENVWMPLRGVCRVVVSGPSGALGREPEPTLRALMFLKTMCIPTSVLGLDLAR